MGDVRGRGKRRVQMPARGVDARVPQHFFQAQQAFARGLVQRRVARGRRVQRQGEGQALRAAGDGAKLRGERGGNHVKSVDEHIDIPQHAGRLHAGKQLPLHVFAVHEAPLKPLLVRGVEPGGVPQLHRKRGHLPGALRQDLDVLRRKAAALEVRDERGKPLHKAHAPARAPVKAQLARKVLQRGGEHHALAALVDAHALGLARALEHAVLQARG